MDDRTTSELLRVAHGVSALESIPNVVRFYGKQILSPEAVRKAEDQLNILSALSTADLRSCVLQVTVAAVKRSNFRVEFATYLDTDLSAKIAVVNRWCFGVPSGMFGKGGPFQLAGSTLNSKGKTCDILFARSEAGKWSLNAWPLQMNDEYNGLKEFDDFALRYKRVKRVLDTGC